MVLVADELEGFSSDETAALRLAAFLGSLRQSVERLDVVLSLNLDIWQSAFLPKLSGGLADRLSEVVVELEPLTDEEMVALLNSHAPGLGEACTRIDPRRRPGVGQGGGIRGSARRRASRPGGKRRRGILRHPSARPGERFAGGGARMPAADYAGPGGFPGSAAARIPRPSPAEPGSRG